MSIRTSIITVAVAAALAVPAVAATATPKHHYSPVVVSSIYPGTSSVSGDCQVTTVAGHVSSFRCPGTTSTGSPGGCTVAVAAGRLWTYSCPRGISGASNGAIPSRCRTVLETGYFRMFSCPKGTFGHASSAALATATGRQGTQSITGRCSIPLTDNYLAGKRCTL